MRIHWSEAKPRSVNNRCVRAFEKALQRKRKKIYFFLFQTVHIQWISEWPPPHPPPSLLWQCFPFQHPLISAIAFVTMETGLLLHLLQVCGVFTIARLTAPVAAAGQRAHRAQNQPLGDTKPPLSVCPQSSTIITIMFASPSHSHHYGLKDYVTTATVWAS